MSLDFLKPVGDFFANIGKAIWDGLCWIGQQIYNFFVWIFNGLVYLIGSVINVINEIFVKPLFGFFATAFGWIWTRIRRSIVILFTVPTAIRAIKRAIRKPGEFTFMRIVLEPLVGFLLSEVAIGLIECFTGIKAGVQPSIAPPLTVTPGVTQVAPGQISLTDEFKMTDSVSIAFVPQALIQVYDSFNVSDSINISIEEPTVNVGVVVEEAGTTTLLFTDSFNMSDSVSVTASEAASIASSDTFSYSDSINVYLE